MNRMWYGMIGATMCLLLCGCDSLRFAPSEAMRQNAWLHYRTTQLTADAAESEQASERVAVLASLSERQSGAFVADYGLPTILPDDSEQAILGEAANVADRARSDSMRRPDVWAAADGLLEVGIGMAGVLGGVYGLRIGQVLRTAKDKAKALREVIEGNEAFKRTCVDAVDAFKQAHAGQSPSTRMLVAQMK